MNRRLHLARVVLGTGALLLALGCASAEDRQRQARAADFNRWLGQDKRSRVTLVGPPDRCSRVKTGPDEVCEWLTVGNALRYRYDANGIARQWTYTDRQSRVTEESQNPAQNEASKGGIWESIKDTFRNMQFSPGVGM